MKATIFDNKKRFDFEVIGSTSIPGIGRRKAKEIFKIYNLEQIIEMYNNETLEENILQIEGISDILASNFNEGIETNIATISFLNEELEIVSLSEEREVAEQTYKFVITGATNMSRSELASKLELKGHKIVGSISSKTDYLITNDTTSGTVKK